MHALLKPNRFRGIPIVIREYVPVIIFLAFLLLGLKPTGTYRGTELERRKRARQLRNIRDRILGD